MTMPRYGSCYLASSSVRLRGYERRNFGEEVKAEYIQQWSFVIDLCAMNLVLYLIPALLPFPNYSNCPS